MEYKDEIINILKKKGEMSKHKLLQEATGEKNVPSSARTTLDKLIEEGIVKVKEKKIGRRTINFCYLSEDEEPHPKPEEVEEEIQKEEHKEPKHTPTRKRMEKEADIEIEHNKKDNQITLPKRLYEYLRFLASLEMKNVDDFVEEIVKEWLMLKGCGDNMVYGVMVLTKNQVSIGKKHYRALDMDFDLVQEELDLKKACTRAKTIMSTQKIPAIVVVGTKSYYVLQKAVDYLKDVKTVVKLKT